MNMGIKVDHLDECLSRSMFLFLINKKTDGANGHIILVAYGHISRMFIKLNT